MLRINLLPPYIYEGAKRRNVTILWVVILLAVIGAFAYFKMDLDRQAKDIKDQEMAITQRANDADNFDKQANDINAASKVIRDKADFVKGAREYNTATYQPLFANIVMYTLRSVLYDSATPAGSQVVLPAFAPSLADVGHYMMAMERNPNINQVSVAIDAIPGFPEASYATGAGQPLGTADRPAGAGHNFTATLFLVKPIPGGPSYPAGTPTASAAAGGSGGGRGGLVGPGGMTGFSGMGGGPSGMSSSMGPPPGMMGGGGPSRPMAAGAANAGGGPAARAGQ